jgi:hypothetical protein
VWQDNRNTNWDIYANKFPPIDIEENSILSPHPLTLSAYPNPFIAKTVIEVKGGCPEIKGNSHSVQIYDLTGKLIRSLPINQLTNKLIWDRRDEAGNKLSPGIYFCKLGPAVARLILL